jgi:acyl-CoA synthetase (AMP-forming)/AMP-acid ligase II
VSLRYFRYRTQGPGPSAWQRIRALFLHNSPQFIIAYYAILRAEAMVVPVNSMSTASELTHVVSDCGARVLITFFVDRLKRMINAAGFKVWPAEVEAQLYAHPAIQPKAASGKILWRVLQEQEKRLNPNV